MKSKIDLLGTVHDRIGFAVDKVLFYGTGGYARIDQQDQRQRIRQEITSECTATIDARPSVRPRSSSSSLDYWMLRQMPSMAAERGVPRQAQMVSVERRLASCRTPKPTMWKIEKFGRLPRQSSGAATNPAARLQSRSSSNSSICGQAPKSIPSTMKTLLSFLVSGYELADIAAHIADRRLWVARAGTTQIRRNRSASVTKPELPSYERYAPALARRFHGVTICTTSPTASAASTPFDQAT